MHTGIDFLHSSFFFFLQCNPLFISLSPCHRVWGENQLTSCERAQRIQREWRLPHNRDLFSFICYLSATTALLQTVILLCVGWLWRYVRKHVLAVHPSTHTNTMFSTGHLTHFSVWITRLQPIMDRQNGKSWKKTLHPACHMSESQTCLSTQWGKDGERECAREREPLSSLPLLTSPPSRTITYPPHPQLKVVLSQWLRFLCCILRKGQIWQQAELQGCYQQKTFIILLCRL